MEANNQIEGRESITDLTYLTSFCEGNIEKIQKYIHVFLKSIPVIVESIKSGLERKDFIEVANQVHGCKTKFTMMGMDQAFRLAMSIEDGCRAGRINEKVIEDVYVLLQHISTAETELKNFKMTN